MLKDSYKIRNKVKQLDWHFCAVTGKAGYFFHVIAKLHNSTSSWQTAILIYFFHGCSVFTDMLHLFVSNNSYELLKHY